MQQRRTDTPPTVALPPARRSADAGSRSWSPTRDVLIAAVLLPLRSSSRWVAFVVAAVLLAESVGYVVRVACRHAACSAADWAQRWDMDALGSVPRTMITLLLAAAAAVCVRGTWRSGRAGAAVWWLVLGSGCAGLAAAKSTSLHSLVEVRLAGVLPGTDVQLLFVVVSCVGLLVVVVSGRWVRRDTRTAVATWLGLYAVASVGLAMVSIVLDRLATIAGDTATLVEESAEALAAVGLLVAVLSGSRSVADRADPLTTRTG